MLACRRLFSLDNSSVRYNTIAKRTKLSNLSRDGLGKLCRTLTSSVETLKLFRLKPGKYDLAILDQTMLCMKGIELGQTVRIIQDESMKKEVN